MKGLITKNIFFLITESDKPNRMLTEDVKVTQEQAEIEQIAAEVLEIQAAEETSQAPDNHTDYTQISKQDFVSLLEKQLATVKEEPSVGAFRKSEDTLKEVKPLFEQIKAQDKQAALDKYLSENESEEGFEFKHDEQCQLFDKLFRQLKDERSKYFQAIEKERDKNLTDKADLLNRLRELVEKAEINTDANAMKNDFAAIKQIQEEWKGAGNVSSSHNNTLWQTYHALVDRFYSNRNIYFELLDLDRKRNLQHKIELCNKLEKMAAAVEAGTAQGKTLDEAIAIFEEYKHIGPAPKEANELVWQRLKMALDVIYGKRREALQEQKEESNKNLELKIAIAELVVPFTTFQSTSINDWNDRTKVLLALQDQWNGIKGSLPREKGRDLSQQFWGNIKTFFRNKGQFFEQLEAKREENLRIKTALCEQVEALVANQDESAEATNTVIRLQKDWKNTGHVPEKLKESIFERFKKACDSFFDKKREKNASVEKGFEENLAQKQALCQVIENEAKTNPDLSKVADYKAQWAAIGFVPRKDMQSISKRYTDAINLYISSMTKLSGKEKEQMVLENEVAMMKGQEGGNTKDLGRKEQDFRHKLQELENDIALWRNNLEFFSKSKNSEKLRADFEKRIERAESDATHLKHQLKVIRQAGR